MDFPQTHRSRWAVLLALCLALLASPASHAAPRIALLVGNAAYTDAPLTNPPNDVKAVAQALKEVGFEVRSLTNAGDKQMSRAIRDFGQAAQGAEIALFYYSGHGMQSRGENYLIPVGAQIQHENDLPVEAVSANQVLRWIEEAAPKAAVVILDACRDNPVAVRSKSGSKGLSRMDAPSGTLVAYATAPGTTASDEGYYAQALAKYIKEPGLALEDVFDRVGADVAKRSRNKQLPRLEDGLYEKVYFVPPTAPQPAPTPPRPAPIIVTPSVDLAEAAYWAEVKKSEDPADYAAYLAAYPNGRYVADANEYIERDKQAKAAKEKLKEDQAWQKAQSGESYADYEAYLMAYPNGHYAAVAKLKQTKLRPVQSVVVATAAPSISEAESLAFQDAHTLLKSGKFNEAVGAFKSFLSQFPSGALAANALFWMGYSYATGQSDFNNAAASYQRLLIDFPNSPKVPDALLSLARAQVQLGDIEAAISTLNQLLNKHPQSKAAEFGKKLLATLK